MAQGTATYELTFTSTWTVDTHPANYPPNPHFSGLIGGTHNTAVQFWSTGETASDGIKSMAELGSKGTLRSEINQAKGDNNADEIIDGRGLGRPPTSTKTTFDIRPPWNLVTVTSMLAPSPDWFVGVSGLNLLDEDMNWIDTLEIDLFVYDAGTDSGSNYTSQNRPTNPREKIERIQESPFLVDGGVRSVGTFRFELKEVKLPTKGYFQVDGTEITGPSGQPIVMKGIGLGGWLLPEGYMLHISTPGRTDGPTGIRDQMIELIGEANTEEFFKIFREKYVQEKDIAAIKEWGFDHIRLPFHYRLFYNPKTDQWEEEGFDLLDTFLEWCRKHEMSVLLDMHAAPGAQSAGGIADSDGEARLWTEPDKYWSQTIKIWREIARRYNDDPIIIGYDLINEPVLPDEVEASDLANLYTRIMNAVQPISPNHLFFLEGNYWATSFDEHLRAISNRKDNIVYAFHHYWKGVDQGAIQYLLNIRDEDKVPLYLGETGENSNAWFYALTKLVEQHDIGINWWTHKKIETITSPLSSPFAPGYEEVIKYWRGDASKPAADAATQALLAMAQNLELDSAKVNRGLLAALLDPEYGTKQKPFKKHELPGIINAVDYDLGNQGIAYNDSEYWRVSDGTTGNSGYNYRNDGVDIQVSSDPEGFGYNVGWTNRFEWMEYTVDILEDGAYEISVRGASNTGGTRTGADIRLFMDGDAIGEVEVGNTGGWQNWVTRKTRVLELKAGTQRVFRVTFADTEVNLNQITFNKVSVVDIDNELEMIETQLLSTYPNPFTEVVNVSFTTTETVSVSAVLYDMLGREVYEMKEASYTTGFHEIELTPDLAPGVYVLRFQLVGSQDPHIFTRPLVIASR